jgi:phosphoribosylaminoimidazolecarboxamide formyltransferase/IMP cyclohydrolase
MRNLIENPRYGENPHQKSAIYSKNNSLKINQIHGKQLSYNNYNDLFSALTISKSLPKNTGTGNSKACQSLWSFNK